MAYRSSLRGGSLPYSWRRDNPDKVGAAMAAGFRFRSQPGARQSPRNYKPIGVDYDEQSGFSTDKSWNDFFRPSRIASGLDSAVPDPNAAQPPGTPMQPPSLSDAEGQAPPTVAPPATPSDTYRSVVDANLQYFNRKGMIPPDPTYRNVPTATGRMVTGRYGTVSTRNVLADRRREYLLDRPAIA